MAFVTRAAVALRRRIGRRQRPRFPGRNQSSARICRPLAGDRQEAADRIDAYFGKILIKLTFIAA
ncbi:hypothetical protein F8B43_0949 [Methylorubrum populi]|uniref:Uncharacterized protein n=1 Tax=Methylorubrum populi TaxID=223967 RepID=A0A833JAA8_9HYPH|nr:hypothetical protein F8B43_0949 [Methylorubrum populi]